MSELKVTERMAMVRNAAKAQLPALESAVKIGSGEYLLETEFGYAKVVISAVKDENFDAGYAREIYLADLAEKEAKAAEKAAEKAAKDAEKEAKKAAKA